MAQTHNIQIMFIFFFQFACLIIAAKISFESNDNPTQLNVPCDFLEANCSASDCHEICGCDSTYIFDKEKAECVLNMEFLKEITESKNYMSSENDMVLEDGIATKIREGVDRVFQGIIGSAIFFIICCSICVISVLIFCCHIHRSDRKLKEEVEAIAKKTKVDIKRKNASTTVRKPQDQIAESCNVIVQDANVMCV